jgi:hypothetical protein
MRIPNLILFLLLSACSSIEIQNVSIEKVSVGRSPGSADPHFQITFKTTTNLWSDQFRDGPSSAAYLCSKGDFRKNQYWKVDKEDYFGLTGRVYENGIWVYGDEKSSLAKKDLPAGSHFYSIYIPVQHEAIPGGRPPDQSYDFVNHPEDLCFYLYGGSYSKYRTQEIVIPASMLVNALANDKR